MRISDWSSDVCSSDLRFTRPSSSMTELRHRAGITSSIGTSCNGTKRHPPSTLLLIQSRAARTGRHTALFDRNSSTESRLRSEEHTSELQSLMRISYAVFCLKKKTPNYHPFFIKLN